MAKTFRLDELARQILQAEHDARKVVMDVQKNIRLGGSVLLTIDYGRYQFEDPHFPSTTRFEQRIAMTVTAKMCPDDRASWDEAMALFRGQLGFYLDYLVPCDCEHQILAKVEAEVRERSVADEFKLRFLMRALVRSVIQHFRECTHQRNPSQSPAQGNSLAQIPAQERLVYFMRDILEYSPRDTSLLIGMTDAQVEKLLSFARSRIDMTEGRSSLEIQAPEWAYFKWKIADLHPS